MIDGEVKVEKQRIIFYPQQNEDVIYFFGFTISSDLQKLFTVYKTKKVKSPNWYKDVNRRELF